MIVLNSITVRVLPVVHVHRSSAVPQGWCRSKIHARRLPPPSPLKAMFYTLSLIQPRYSDYITKDGWRRRAVHVERCRLDCKAAQRWLRGAMKGMTTAVRCKTALCSRESKFWLKYNVSCSCLNTQLVLTLNTQNTAAWQRPLTLVCSYSLSSQNIKTPGQLEWVNNVLFGYFGFLGFQGILRQQDQNKPQKWHWNMSSVPWLGFQTAQVLIKWGPTQRIILKTPKDPPLFTTGHRQTSYVHVFTGQSVSPVCDTL